MSSDDDDPARKAEMADSLSLAFLVLLESLSPEQRAAFLLHEVFDEPYDRIAEIIGTSEQNARQLVTRGRRHVEERRHRFEASRQQQEQLATRFFAAAEEGDLEALEELLAHDVVLHGDGGGKAPAIARAIHGRTRVARTLIAGLRTATRVAGFTVRRKEVNRQPGALFFDRDEQGGRRHDPRRRRWPDPGRELDRQPRQVAAPGAGGRPACAAAPAELDPSARGHPISGPDRWPLRATGRRRIQ